MGPTVGIGEMLAGTWAYRDLVRHLVVRDLRLKYKGSTLGFAWSFANPVLMAVVYTIAFKYIVRVPIDRFTLFLLSGLLPWTFFASGLAAATAAIVDNGSLVRKVAFPRLVLPLAAVIGQFVQFLAMYLLIVPGLAAFEGVVSAALLAIPAIALLQLCFTSGLGLLLAAAYVHARDVRHLLDVALHVWFWVTPIVYSLALVPASLGWLMMWNPMAWFITAYHEAVVDGRWPAASTFGVLTLCAGSAVLLGLVVFARRARRFAELV